MHVHTWLRLSCFMGAALERQHVLNKDYFAFMLQLVEADAQASSHKVCRV